MLMAMCFISPSHLLAGDCRPTRWTSRRLDEQDLPMDPGGVNSNFALEGRGEAIGGHPPWSARRRGRSRGRG